MDRINNAAIYANPAPDNPGYMYVKLVAVQVETVPDCIRPKLHARFRLAPMHGSTPNGDNHFSSIIHPTERATPIWQAFCETFRIADGDYQAAVGRFGSVRLTAAHYGGKDYGCIGYVYQPLSIRYVCSDLEDQDQRGELQW